MRITPPSKKFIKVVFGAGVFLAFIFIISTFLPGTKSSFGGTETEAGKQAIEKMPLNALVDMDSNNNGIPDWQETLWGLDPKGDGVKNKQIIEDKQAALDAKNGTTDTTPLTPANETDQFAREFFATIASLKQAGTLDQNTISGLATQLSQNVGDKMTIPDTYTTTDIQTGGTAKTYYSALKNIITSNGSPVLGNEFSTLADAIGNEDQASLSKLGSSADTYDNVAKAMKSIPVPAGEEKDHVSLMNSYTNIGTGLRNMTDTLDNPMMGMIGITQYKYYGDQANAILKNIGVYFSDNGILTK